MAGCTGGRLVSDHVYAAAVSLPAPGWGISLWWRPKPALLYIVFLHFRWTKCKMSGVNDYKRQS